MPAANPGIVSLNGGEIGELAQGRIDLESYAGSLSRCENFIPLPQGGITRRPGTRFVGAVRDSAAVTRLMPFIFSDDDAALLVFNDGYIQFVVDRAFVESSPGVRYEIAHSWAEGILFELDFVQSGDIIYVVHGSTRLRQINRFGLTNWTITEPDLNDGPFLDENATATTVSPSALTGTGTLTASSPIFDADHVGGLFLIFTTRLDVTNVQPWEPGKTYTAPTDYAYYNGRLYNCASSPAVSGTVPPSHDDGVRWDGKSGASCAWNFVSSLYGVVRITAFTSSTVVDMEVLATLPYPLSIEPSARWAFGAWSDFYGYPGCITFYQDRLVQASTDQNPDSFWMSATGDYLNYAPRDSGGLIAADLGVSGTVSSGSVNKIRYIHPDGTGIYCNTTGGEFLIAPQTANEPLSQNNVRAIPQTNRGCAQVKPVTVDAATLFVQKGERKLREAAYAYDNDRYQAGDATQLHPNILMAGVKAIGWAPEPYSLVPLVLDDGTMAWLTYNKDQGVLGWHRHIIAGTYSGGASQALDLAVIPSPDGVKDDPWLAVRRTIDGASVQYIEVVDFSWEIQATTAIEAFYVDGGITSSLWSTDPSLTFTLTAASYALGASGTLTTNFDIFGPSPGQIPIGTVVHMVKDKNYQFLVTAITDLRHATVTLGSAVAADFQATASSEWGTASDTMTGLDHLEGETLQCLLDGAYHPDVVVSGGGVTFNYPAMTRTVGLGYRSRARTVRIEAGAAAGTAQGKIKRITKVRARLVNSLSFLMGTDASIALGQDRIVLRESGMLMSGPVTPFTGDTQEMPWPAGYDTEGYICVETDQATPVTITAFWPELVTQG
jgi:hypothetical protein